MAYTPWSVVFGETPSASKWNILGANDASFADGTGIGNLALQQRHIGQTGLIVNEQLFLDATQANGTGLIPYDDTIPQISEGSQFLSATYTPITSGNKLLIEATLLAYSGSSTTQNMAMALFNGGANAIGTDSIPAAAGSPLGGTMLCKAIMTAPSTSPITFSVRGGLQISGTFSMNGIGSSRFFGGTWFSGIKVTEVRP